MKLDEIIQIAFGILIMLIQVVFALAFCYVVIAGLWKTFFGS